MEQSQIHLVDQIQKVYRSQSVHISDKHIEIIVRQMTFLLLLKEFLSSFFNLLKILFYQNKIFNDFFKFI